MKQFAIIGLSGFGRQMLEQFLEYDCETLIIDKDQAVVDLYEDKVTAAYVADAINEVIKKLVPESLDPAVVDLGDRLEVSILVTNYLKKLGIPEIVARAETDEHGEILRLVGATRVVFPDSEAAARIAPLMISAQMFSYLPLGDDFAIVEVTTPENCVGKSLIESEIREKYSLTVIAYRNKGVQSYQSLRLDQRLTGDEVLLVAGRERDVVAFAGIGRPERRSEQRPGLIGRLFGRRR